MHISIFLLFTPTSQPVQLQSPNSDVFLVPCVNNNVEPGPSLYIELGSRLSLYIIWTLVHFSMRSAETVT